MINSSLRRTALVAAAIASLSVHAAAHGDAALSIALGAMRAPLATIDILKTQAQSPAAAQALGPRVPFEVWMRILNNVRRHGTFTPPAPGWNVGTWEIELPYDDSLGEYTHRFLTIIGAPITSDEMLLESAQFIAMKRIVNGNEIRIDAWRFITDFQGQLEIATHTTVTGPIGGELKYGAPTVHNIADPKISARYDALIKSWANY